MTNATLNTWIDRMHLMVGRNIVKARVNGADFRMSKTSTMHHDDRLGSLNIPGETATELFANAPNMSRDQLHTAIGYLACWATDTYPRVQIYCADVKEPELVAIYRDALNQPRYTIHAIWNGTAFGFHS
jgi:hypothetical protein